MTRPAKSADISRPESIKATVMPAPVYLLFVNPSMPRSVAGFLVVVEVSRAVRCASTDIGSSNAVWSPRIGASNEIDSTRGSAISCERSSESMSTVKALMKS